MTETFDHEAALEEIPHEPGCYLMKDDRGRVIYIGKAKDLHDRVRDYFVESGDARPFVSRLPMMLDEIETIITANEKEALILENTLIKDHQPRFNVQLKDDKNFLSLRIDTDHEWPRVEVVREQKDDGAEYFGPYSSAGSIRKTLNLINKHFGLRSCPDSVLNNRDRPCLQYQIDRCPAPCVYDIDRQSYMEQLEGAMMFLEGRGDALLEELREKMQAASDELEFERAAEYRDQIRSIEKILEQQVAVNSDDVDQDAFGFYREEGRVTMQVLFVRDGRMEGTRSFAYKDQEFADEEVLSSFLNLYYSSSNHIPREVLLPFELESTEMEAFEELLTDLSGERVYLKTPKQGKKRALVETACTNAEHSFEREHSEAEQRRDVLGRVQRDLDLRNFPERIECYDVSNLQGDQIAGSKVAFVDGEPDKERYRHYEMKDVDSQDDFASMREVLMRRFRKVAEGEEDAPDLVVIDGGKGQLAQASTVLEDLGLHGIDLVSLAKSRTDRSGFGDPEVTSSPERVFFPNRKNPLRLDSDSSATHLLQRVRDEAHRFAIEYHKKLRRDETLSSSLDEVPGVGPALKRKLLHHFGGLHAVKSASADELTGVSGVGEAKASTIREHFSGEQ
ncbi:MAG: excinuclease ABC subunit UvrC [Bradymonadaceae bacterium]